MKKKTLWIVLLAAVLVVALVLIIYALNSTKQETKIEKIGETKSTETTEGEIGAEETIGNLEISVEEPEQGSYQLSALENTGTEENPVRQRVMKTIKYKTFYTEVFNPTEGDLVFESIKLIDNLGNEYKPDSNPDAIKNVQDFGRDPIVSKSTRRKGHLIFLNMDNAAKTFELVFELNSGEKKVYEFGN